MNSFSATLATTVFATTLVSCSSAGVPAGVDFENHYRFAGTRQGVRVDAQIVGSAAQLPFRLVYEVENQRTEEIAIVPDASLTSYDHQSRTITVRLGAEIPESEEMLVARIRPGERRRFSVAATPGSARGLHRTARFIQVQLTYLREVESFQPLTAEGDLEVVRVGDAVVPRWLEQNERLVTNALPLGSQFVPANPLASSARGAMYARPVSW